MVALKWRIAGPKSIVDKTYIIEEDVKARTTWIELFEAHNIHVRQIKVLKES